MIPTIAEIMAQHVVFEVESIDRLYLNGYVAGLQTPESVAYFLKRQYQAKYASSVLLDPISRDFQKRIECFVRAQGIAMHRFEKGERKDEQTLRRLKSFAPSEGIVYLGTAQEKQVAIRTSKRINPATGASFPWLVKGTVLAKVFYWYLLDEDFGPLFIKFGSYFPYPVKVCLNGNEYLKRQLAKEGIAFDPLDNGLLNCADPARAQQIADGMDDRRIAALFAKWMDRLPHPFRAEDRAAGYDYSVSILQAEFSLTQVFERPMTGRQFFEQIIKDNVTLGHPSRLQLIFERRIIKTTPGLFRTRIISDGVIPSLHLDYKNTRIKQYHKEGRALRTETTINDTRDFGLGRALGNLAKLRAIGFAANRRLLRVQTSARDAIKSEDAFRHVHEPVITAQGNKIAGLRFGDFRVQQLMQSLIVISVLSGVLRARQLRSLQGNLPAGSGLYTPGRTTYDLRRLCAHGLIARIPGKLAYTLTDFGLSTALFYVHAYDRLIAPGSADFHASIAAAPTQLRQVFVNASNAWHHHVDALLSKAA
ncbi:MAG: hypothetical protein WC378_08840 [Opitutaceae bacterium]|jgi:hypothetical protein